MRLSTLLQRARASSSPRIASPSRFRLTRKPSPVRRFTYLLKVGSSAARMTSAVSFPMRQSTACSQTHGIAGATLPRVARPSRSNPPSDAGTPPAVRSWRRSAARLRSRILSTWSVRSSSRSRPASSASSRARRLDEAASAREVSPSDASNSAMARASALSTRTASDGKTFWVPDAGVSTVGALMARECPCS